LDLSRRLQSSSWARPEPGRFLLRHHTKPQTAKDRCPSRFLRLCESIFAVVLTFFLQVQSLIFCRRPITKSLLLLPWLSPTGSQKRFPKNGRHQKASEDHLEHEKASKTDPKINPKIVKFGVLFSWPLLGQTWASLATSWPVWVPILPPSGPILSQLAPSWPFLVPILPPSWPILRST
jgi:hypothetical protein